MLVYAGIFLILLIKIVIKKENAKDNLLFLSLAFILGFNYLMGNDWYYYKGHYEGLAYKFDWGYTLYVTMAKKLFGLSYEMFMGITISICVYILLKNIKKRSENYYFAIIIYLVIFLLAASLEPVIRQMIGITIIASGFKYIEKKNFLKYFILVIIAGQFHSSLYIGLVFYFLDKIEISFFKFLILTIFIFFMVENIDKILSIRNSLTAILRFEKFAVYITLMESIGHKLTIGAIVRFMMICGYVYIIFNSYKKNPKKENYILNGALIYCLISMFIYKFEILYRVAEIFSIFFVIAISSMDRIEFFQGFTLNKRTGEILMISFALFQISMYYRTLQISNVNNFRYGTYRNYIVERMKYGFYENKVEREQKYMDKLNQLVEEEKR